MIGHTAISARSNYFQKPDHSSSLRWISLEMFLKQLNTTNPSFSSQIAIPNQQVQSSRPNQRLHKKETFILTHRMCGTAFQRISLLAMVYSSAANVLQHYVPRLVLYTSSLQRTICKPTAKPKNRTGQFHSPPNSRRGKPK